jgi:hypothetical protein
VERKTREKLRREELSAEEEQAVYLGLSTVEGIIECLKSHVIRIHKAEYEFTDFAELISRGFISVAQDGNGYVAQDQLNNAKQVLLPLWEQSRFDERFIRFLPE